MPCKGTPARCIEHLQQHILLFRIRDLEHRLNVDFKESYITSALLLLVVALLVDQVRSWWHRWTFIRELKMKGNKVLQCYDSWYWGLNLKLKASNRVWGVCWTTSSQPWRTLPVLAIRKSSGLQNSFTPFPYLFLKPSAPNLKPYTLLTLSPKPL